MSNDLERIENLILVLLEAKKPSEARWHSTGIRRGVDGARLEIADAGSLLHARPMINCATNLAVQGGEG